MGQAASETLAGASLSCSCRCGAKQPGLRRGNSGIVGDEGAIDCHPDADGPPAAGVLVTAHHFSSAVEAEPVDCVEGVQPLATRMQPHLKKIESSSTLCPSATCEAFSRTATPEAAPLASGLEPCVRTATPEFGATAGLNNVGRTLTTTEAEGKAVKPSLLLPPGATDGSRLLAVHGDEGDGSCRSRSSRSARRCQRRRLSVTHTMCPSPSAALQIMINNPGALESYHSVEAGQPLGEGTFGVVRKSTVLSTKAVRAVKFINKNRMKEKTECLKSEIDIMKRVDHPNVVMLYEIFEDDVNLYLVMELCVGGHLQGYIRNQRFLREPEAACAMQQILRAVYYLHRSFVCHRDLKAQNILVSARGSLQKTLLKVSDFGLSCVFRPSQTMSQKVGTVSHMAPEVFDKRYNELCDIWSCGIILYHMVCGLIAFQNEEEVRLARFNFNTPEWCNASQEMTCLLGHITARNVKARYTACNALQHAWFSQKLPVKETQLKLPHGDLLSTLKGFRSLNKLKRSALTMIASMLPDAQVAASRDLFIRLDSDGDGLVSMAEVERQLKLQRPMLQRGMTASDLLRSSRLARSKTTAEFSKPHEEVEAAFHESYKAAPKVCDFQYTEFLAATFDRKTNLTDAVCLAAFDSFDRDKNGFISLSELACGSLLGKLTKEELQHTLQDLDQNGDASIDFTEFLQMLQN